MSIGTRVVINASGHPGVIISASAPLPGAPQWQVRDFATLDQIGLNESDMVAL